MGHPGHIAALVGAAAGPGGSSWLHLLKFLVGSSLSPHWRARIRDVTACRASSRACDAACCVLPRSIPVLVLSLLFQEKTQAYRERGRIREVAAREEVARRADWERRWLERHHVPEEGLRAIRAEPNEEVAPRSGSESGATDRWSVTPPSWFDGSEWGD